MACLSPPACAKHRRLDSRWFDPLLPPCSQEDSTQDVDIDLHARYFHRGYFAYVATDGLNADNLNVGVGRMFNIKDWVYVDPKVVYNTTDETLNLSFGFGLKF